jgi:enoyl-CoA hydratase/carnithine racemase
MGSLLIDEPAPGVLRLTISNPARRGALDHAILDELFDTLDRARARVVIVTGEAGSFSAGYDISGIPNDVFAVEAEALVAHPFTRAIDALSSYPQATIAAIGGHAIGGGLELALACDMRIAEEQVMMGMPPAKLGLVYSHTGMRRFIDAIGAPRTRELFLRGRNIDADTALEWGLVNDVVATGRAAGAAVDLAVELVGNSPLSIAGNKRVIEALLETRGELDQRVEDELIELRRRCFESEDMREGVQAFAEKRRPRWQGR